MIGRLCRWFESSRIALGQEIICCYRIFDHNRSCFLVVSAIIVDTIFICRNFGVSIHPSETDPSGRISVRSSYTWFVSVISFFVRRLSSLTNTYTSFTLATEPSPGARSVSSDLIVLSLSFTAILLAKPFRTVRPRAIYWSFVKILPEVSAVSCLGLTIGSASRLAGSFGLGFGSLSVPIGLGLIFGTPPRGRWILEWTGMRISGCWGRVLSTASCRPMAIRRWWFERKDAWCFFEWIGDSEERVFIAFGGVLYTKYQVVLTQKKVDKKSKWTSGQVFLGSNQQTKWNGLECL